MCRDVLDSLSDHCVLSFCLPCQLVAVAAQPSPECTVYKWQEGTNLGDYAESWVAWSQHTDSEPFADGLAAILQQHQNDVDQLAFEVEKYFLDEALRVGVVQKVVVRQPKNPNQRGKYLAPWFNAECKLKRQQYKQNARLHGRFAEQTKISFAEYRAVCNQAKKVYSSKLPDLMKYQPK